MTVEVAAVEVTFTVGMTVGKSVTVVVVRPSRTMEVSVTVSVEVGKAGRVRVVVRPSELEGC